MTFKFKAMLLCLLMLFGIIAPTVAIAQRNDGFFKGNYDNYDNRDVSIDDGGGISNWGIGETVPLGSGLLILTAVGAGYAIYRRRNSYKTNATHKSYNNGAALFLALVMLLCLTNCKKKMIDSVTPTSSNDVKITLNVDGNNSKVIVDPTNNGQNDMASVKFEAGDIVYVGYNNNYVGYLTYTVESEENK